MPNIGPMEILILGVLIVILFGPAKLPEIARSIGRGTRDFKDSIEGTGIQDAIDGVNAVKPSNIAKAAIPAPVKEMTAGVTEMKETFTDPLGMKKAERGKAGPEDLDESPDVEAEPLPASRPMPVVEAPAPAASPAPEPPAVPSA